MVVDRTTPTEQALQIVRDRVYQDSGRELDTSDVYLVWFCYILGGWKALVSTTIMDDRYYEVTHSATGGQTFLDTYKKESNHTIVGVV